MGIRRAAYWASLGAIIVVPAWVMLGRGLFGAPLGEHLLGLGLLAPVLALCIAAIVGVTIARKSVRDDRAFAWRDVRVVWPWLAGLVLFGVFVTDASAGREGSILTQWLGDGALEPSRALAALTSFLTFAGGAVVLFVQVRALGREARERVTRLVDELNERAGVRPPPVERDATFERVDPSPHAGRTIRIDQGRDEPER